ncbi:uncharacterized protein FIBRA_07794 [Fibroporia radiculosa]|uniref:Uncharacterized protein n=1 Tax=Fibroporia radiculosa TaxID=599839 RepID=J4I1D6_9APHY|nr:uncharacterized protein FIBRA_07794 [Fibroporia radiculosa]CCM05567.1 predicted protein [Fibroporia radiculosa]
MYACLGSPTRSTSCLIGLGSGPSSAPTLGPPRLLLVAPPLSVSLHIVWRLNVFSIPCQVALLRSVVIMLWFRTTGRVRAIGVATPLPPRRIIAMDRKLHPRRLLASGGPKGEPGHDAVTTSPASSPTVTGLSGLVVLPDSTRVLHLPNAATSDALVACQSPAELGNPSMNRGCLAVAISATARIWLGRAYQQEMQTRRKDSGVAHRIPFDIDHDRL